MRSNPSSLVFAALVLCGACEGPGGPAGAPGTPGSAGDGSSAIAPWLTQPGAAITVTGTTFSSAGLTIAFTVTDGSGAGLDLSGRLTDGTVAASFVVAQLALEADGTPGQYTAYTTDQVTSGSGAVATQPITETAGTYTTVDVTQGEYTYAVAAPLTGLDPTLTQTVGALAVRTTGTAEVISRDLWSARPDGGAVVAREVVTDATCDSCHSALNGHGGRWVSPTQCVLCHQPQNSDPTSGNTLDFKVMVHKIHSGASLPSVVAGTPYQIIGYMKSVNDFSKVVFPQPVQRCTACHAGAQGDRWETAPSKLVCTSCHDTTSFVLPVPAGMVAHGGGSQPDNAMCAVCHPATGSLAGIADKHLTGLLAASAPTVALTIESMSNTAPGQAPTMTFTALVNGAPADLIGTPLTALTATIAGPTTDYATEWQAKIQGAPAVGTLSVVDVTTGTYRYVFPAAAVIPAAATGSYSVALEGYIQPTPADPRYAALNPVLTFAVTDATPAPRRTVVALAQCNGCHGSLAAHGGMRTNPQYCVFCHNTTGADTAGAPRFQGTTNVLADTIDFRHFIHKVHAGTSLSEPFVIGGFPLPTIADPAGTPNDFGAILYPRALTDCGACHAAKNWTLPLAASPAYTPSTSALMACTEPVTSPTAFCDAPFWNVTSTTLIPPTASVCTSCHDGPAVAAHAQLNTTPAGVEACATCHGTGAVEDVGALHGFP